MFYLHVIDTLENIGETKSMFIESESAEKMGKLISLAEVDNLVIINEVIKIKGKRKMEIKFVFLNGYEGVNCPELNYKKNDTDI